MRITFVGTSNANPRSDRGQSCLLLEEGGAYHLLDCGDGAPTKLFLDSDVDWSRFRSLLTTHLHPDHAAGSFVFLHLLYMQAKENPEWSLCREGEFTWHLPPGEGSRKVAACMGPFHMAPEKFPFPFRVDFYETARSFTAGRVKVTPWPTGHCEESHGFTVEGAEKKIVFTGDLGSPADLVEPARGADMVITECAHFHPEELVDALFKTEARHFVITHMHDRLAEKPEQAAAFFRPLEKAGMVTLAHDGLVLDVR